MREGLVGGEPCGSPYEDLSQTRMMMAHPPVLPARLSPPHQRLPTAAQSFIMGRILPYSSVRTLVALPLLFI